MPYIKREDKLEYADALAEIQAAFASVGAGDGDLNYVLTKVTIAWLMYHKPPYNYSMRSDAYKALVCAAEEFYWRVLRPYEDKKISENGDVYPLEVL